MAEGEQITRSNAPGFQRLRAWVSAAIDLVLPPQCLACRALVTEPGRLCPSCWPKARFIAPPSCTVCGRALTGTGPSPGLPDLDLTCGACLQSPPQFTRARSVLIFDGVGRDLVHQLKYADRLDGAGAMGAWMVQAAGEAAQTADLIVPVPLHYLRLVRRRYNQAQILAQVIARETGLPLESDGLRRVRRTKSQVGLNARERAENVRGAFQVSPKLRDRLAQARVLLVDDVLTTGATVSACAQALSRAGASEVTVLTLARADDGAM